MKLKSAAIFAATTAVFFASSIPASADTIFGVYAGGGLWDAELSGDLGNPSVSAQELGAGSHNNYYFYVALEHPVPLVPNIKLQYNDISSAQKGTLTTGFELDDTAFAQGSRVTSDLDLSYTDASLYYEILDNWLNLDVGLTLRKFDGYLQASTADENATVELDQTIPLLYGRFQFDLPLTGFSAGFEGNYVDISKASLTDYSAKIGYLFDSIMDLGVELGYRYVAIEVDDGDAQGDLTLKGPYAAAVFHF